MNVQNEKSEKKKLFEKLSKGEFLFRVYGLGVFCLYFTKDKVKENHDDMTFTYSS